MVNKIDFKAKKLTSNAGIFLLLENAKNSGIFELIEKDLVFDNESTNKIRLIDCFDEKYIQIDTFGSKERKYNNKVSQSIRINKEVATQLSRIINDNFDL